VNEAFTLGQAGARVLVIDADVRRPALHRLFDLPNGHGLTSYLAGQSALEAIVHKVDSKGVDTNGNSHFPAGSLSVIPSGPVPPNPAELLGSERMRELLDLLRKNYDYVLLDTPPVLPVTDAVVLGRMCDGVVLVVRGQKTPIDLVAACRDRLLRSRARIIGAVLNALDLSTGDYEKHYRYYYSYYAEDHRPEP
jgi:capsular exopolysaccharide synthesis family protein